MKFEKSQTQQPLFDINFCRKPLYRFGLPGPILSSDDTGQRISFLLLVGFVATQGHLVPLFPLPLNWAVWPCLSDFFALGMVVTTIFSEKPDNQHPFDLATKKFFGFIVLFCMANFLLLTVPTSKTGDGVKYGGFAIILLLKYYITFLAVTRIQLNEKRIFIIHLSALIAFLWLCCTLIGDSFGILDITSFTHHLPLDRAGKWAAPYLNSTVSNTHGQTGMVILLLSALIIGTTKGIPKQSTYWVVFVLGGLATILSGSRQGIVRFALFIVTMLVRDPAKVIFTFLTLTACSVLFLLFGESPGDIDFSGLTGALSRHAVLLDNPLTEEALSGRPTLWLKVLNILYGSPFAIIAGIGIGNYVEYNANAHNMFLQVFLDGGFIGLVIYNACLALILVKIWKHRNEAWPMMAATLGMMISAFTGSSFYPTLATGWYLGSYFIACHICFSTYENRTDFQRHSHGSKYRDFLYVQKKKSKN